MVATLSLDTITSSGSNITIDATKTLTVNGALLSAGSTNILHKTGNYPIAEADVSGKSELIITTTTATPRDITLPLISVTGADTCIITVVVSADATSTNSVRVMDGGSEAWTGYQKGDFAKFCVSDGAWVVLDHKETYYARRYLTANSAAIAPGATTKLAGWTSVTEIGNTWDNSNNKLTTPTGMNGYWTVSWNPALNIAANALAPNLFIGGASVSNYAQVSGTSGYRDGQNGVTGRYYATSAQDVEFYIVNIRSDAGTYYVQGGSVSSSHFTAQFERVY